MTDHRLQLPALRRSWWTSWRPFFVAHPTLAPLGRTSLTEGEVIAFESDADVRVECVGGTAWITQEGEARDFVARPGDCFVPAERGKVVIQAISNVVVKVSQVVRGRPRMCTPGTTAL